METNESQKTELTQPSEPKNKTKKLCFYKKILGNFLLITILVIFCILEIAVLITIFSIFSVFYIVIFAVGILYLVYSGIRKIIYNSRR